MRQVIRASLFVMALVCILAFPNESVVSAVPATISYQGAATDSGGNALSGAHTLTVRFWDDSTGGIDEYVEIHSVSPSELTLTGGIVTVQIGSVTPIPDDLFDADELWLGVEIDNDGEMMPRKRLTSVPYAIVASRISGDFQSAPNVIKLDAYEPSPTPAIPDLPGPGEPYLLIADDVFGQLFYSMAMAGRLSSSCQGCGTGGGDRGCELLPDGIRMVDGTDTAHVRLADGVVEVIPPIATEGLSLGGIVTFGDPRLLSITSVPGTDSVYMDNSLLDYLSVTGDLTRLTSDGITVMTSFGADTAMRLGTDGLTLNAGTLDLSSSGLSVGNDLDVGGSVTVADGGTFTSGGTLTFSGAGQPWTSVSDSGVTSGFGSVTIVDSGVSLQSDLTAGSLTVTSGGSLDLVTLGESSGSGRLVLDGSGSTSLRADAGTLTIDDGGSTPLTLATGSSGGTLTFSGGTSGGSLSASADDVILTDPLGDVRVESGGLTLEPSGGGAGGRVVLTTDDVTLTDETLSDEVVISRTGLTLVLDASGTSAVYTADGVQLTGPTAKAFEAHPTSISLTRPSTNAAMICDLDATDLCVYDVDDDGSSDVVITDDPSPRVYLAGGTTLRCDGPAELSSCDVTGGGSYGGSVTVSGSMTCDSGLDVSGSLSCSGSSSYSSSSTFDPDDDASDDVLIRDNAGTVELRLSSTTALECDGLARFGQTLTADGGLTLSSGTTETVSSGASLVVSSGASLDVAGTGTFSNPVEIGGPSGIPPGSYLHVNGDITATGAKLFVEDHPLDPSKQIAFTALEGPEAGTYTRGTATLIDGTAVIPLPESFSLVSASEGLTAQVTPRGPVQSMLYVAEVSPEKLVVKASNKKDGDVTFDFMVNGIRTGYEDYESIRDKPSYTMNESGSAR